MLHYSPILQNKLIYLPFIRDDIIAAFGDIFPSVDDCMASNKSLAAIVESIVPLEAYALMRLLYNDRYLTMPLSHSSM